MGKVSKGYSKSKIARAPTMLLRSNKDADGNVKQCVLCMEDLEKFDTLLRIKCKHEFHKDCLVQGLLENKECPICKEICL